MTEYKTGYYVRFERGGSIITIDIADLTEDEWVLFLDKQEPERAKAWACALHTWIREHVLSDDENEDDNDDD